MLAMNPKKIMYLLIHTSVSKWGDVEDITEWHKDRGFETIGYHKVIVNQYPDYRDLKDGTPRNAKDGEVHEGRSLKYVGAHCPGYNNRSIGICLIGADGRYTAKQLASLDALCRDLMAKFGIPAANILGHGETPNGKAQGKTCPDLDMKALRARVAA